MITKEQNALLTIKSNLIDKFISDMGLITPIVAIKAVPERKKTRKDFDLIARKDWDFYLTKKNLC